MDGLHMLAGLIVFMFFLTIVVIFGMYTDSTKCESKGGVYVYKIHKCMKKEYFIDIR